MQADPRFTILLPIVRPPHYLASAVQTVLAQTLADFELVIICDGAPESTVAAAHDWRRRDERIRTLVRPKGQRHGETHRHEALSTARGRSVAHIDDDGVWFPDHLAVLGALLSRAAFAHTQHVRLQPDGSLAFLLGNLDDEPSRRRMATTPFNWFGITNAGYQMAAYRALPTGWAPAPSDVWSDLHMWRKLIAAPDSSFATSMRITALFLERPAGDETPEAISQHAEMVARVLTPGSTVQADLEATMHRLVLCKLLPQGELACLR